MRLRGFVFAVTIMTASCCLSQTALLVGFQRAASHEGEKWNPPGYRTLLITFHDAKAEVSADIPALIVPRKDGFWRLGVLHDGSEDNYMETPYAVPAFSAPPNFPV